MRLKAKNFLKRQFVIGGLPVAGYEAGLFCLIIFFYFFTRFYHLTVLPVFADEAIYIRWAQVMRAEPTLRFISLQDGKQPLFMWLTIPALKMFSDPLFAGRFVSVLSGFATMLGLGGLAFLVFRKVKIILLVMFLYLTVPYVLFFDRMALVDALLSAFAIWSLVFAIILGRTKRLDAAMILGMILGGALLIKSPGMFFALMAPAVAAISLKLKSKNEKLQFKAQNLLKFLVLLGVSLTLAFGIYNILRLGPNFHMIKIRNKDYVWPVAEILKHPFNPLIPHLKDITRYYYSYLTLPVFALGGLGVLGILRDRKKRLMGAVLLSWWLFPLLVEMAIAKTFTGRYILFSAPVFLLFAGLGLEKLMSQVSKSAKILLLVLFLAPAFFFDWRLWFNPARAPLPRDDYAGYLENWTAGEGIRETADYIKRTARAGNRVVVGTEGFFGTLPDGLQIYLEKEPDVTVLGVGYPLKSIPKSLVNAKEANDKVYLVINASRLEMANNKQLRLIKAYIKPGGDKLLFFEVLQQT